mgnify:CR=1 FL=1
MSTKKIKYEKPQSMAVGKIASVLGATCSTGTGAIDGCGWGNDPTSIPYCDTGAIATGNCYPHGGQAGQSCHIGDSPGW